MIKREIKKFKQPSLAEQMDIVEDWWMEVDPKKRLEAPLGEVAMLFVNKGIA